VFLSTTGDVLNDAQQAAFEAWVRAGGGYAGVHAAADTEYSWPFYGTLVGAWFDSHPAIQPALVRVEDHDHPATAHFGDTWQHTDELYNYRTNPRSTAHVLATLDESTYSGGTMGADHPISWCKTVGSGRSFYTGLGHTQETYARAEFRTHLLGGIRYAAGVAPADCSVAGPQPGARVEAESFTSQSGIQVVADPGAHGGNRVGYVEPGDWIGFAGVDVAGATGFTARVASGGPGGTVQVRAGSPTGPVLGSVTVPNTGGYGTWVDVSTSLTAGSGPLHLVFTGSGGGLFDVDDFALTR
jgi:type 1 glutamine amidotransferase